MFLAYKRLLLYLQFVLTQGFVPFTLSLLYNFASAVNLYVVKGSIFIIFDLVPGLGIRLV